MSAVPVAIRPRDAAALLGAREDFPDRRLWKRVPRMIDAFARRLRCPPAKEGRAEQRATRRWVANRRLEGPAMLAKVLGDTALSCVGHELLVAAHDSSEIDEHGRGCPEDAGPLRSSNARGYMLHQAVIAVPGGACLGAIEAEAWTRPWDLRHKDHASREMSEKESRKWDRGIERTERRLEEAGFGGRIIHVEDREADIYEHLVNQRLEKRALVVRHDQARGRMVQAPGGDGGEQPCWVPLQSRLEALPWCGTYPVQVDGRVHDRALGLTHQRRTASVSFRFCEAMLKPPKHYRRHQFLEGLPVWLVEARECSAPTGAEPLHWILICLGLVLDDEQAKAAIDFYRTRWKVEDYTKIIKSGCQLEVAHVDDLASFERLLAVAMATANQLAGIVAACREAPDRSAHEVVEPKVLHEVRDACEYHRIAWPPGRVSVRQLLLCVAQVGGHEIRADREPGWLVLCRGWAVVAEYAAVLRHHELHREQRRLRRRVSSKSSA